ncbi:TIGR03088 family PEP-CTERM/XrtA system glycosyltransferase [Rubrivivax sp. RP6-9]|uniref:TIGR03088 family PEP-CTERM/XrtA system glycosyltransferase n=1 Tax=Rubrivivax sp. RP6-9 TaxID=3415750 RepID=UPI003CC6A395
MANLINHMPASAYRHAVVALTEVTAFRSRIVRDDVTFVSMRKAPGHGLRQYVPFWRLLRQLRPAVVHTRNLGPLEMQVPAAVARVPVRVHGEHGRELNDLDGSNRRLQRVRRLYAPFVHRYVALSCDLEQYLVSRVGIAPGRISQIYNGVDAERFRPAAGPQPAISGCPFGAPQHWLLGTVGRMQGVKDQTLLAHAFVQALQQHPALRARLRLLMVGDGPLRAQAQAVLHAAGVADLAWLPGERSDVADVMRGLNCFVLPSLAEGISNTILEAMACGQPVIATAVGGNVELVDHGRTGLHVPAADAAAMAQAIAAMALEPGRAVAFGAAGRLDVERRFSLASMVGAYQALYDRQLAAVHYDRRNA